MDKQELLLQRDISKNIRKLRKSMGLSQEDTVARLQAIGLNVTRTRLADAETNRRLCPVSMVIGLKIIFKCEYSDLLGDTEVQLTP